jgi:hypothetical protein
MTDDGAEGATGSDVEGIGDAMVTSPAESVTTKGRIISEGATGASIANGVL